ncbi:MAG: hypothetical protein U0324_18080 [Polyangiales bacterium]
MTSSAPPASAFDAFDEAPTVARAQPALAPPPAVPVGRSDHATLVGVPPPAEAAPALVGPAFVGAGARWSEAPRPIRWAPPPAPPPPSPVRNALMALAFALAVLIALAAAKAALDASARSRAERQAHAAGRP